MKKAKIFEDTYSQRQMTAIMLWEKQRANGKWFWIFKRGAIWLTAMLFVYGLFALTFPAVFHFQRLQLYILFGMSAGVIISAIQEWAKMESAYQQIRK